MYTFSKSCNTFKGLVFRIVLMKIQLRQFLMILELPHYVGNRSIFITENFSNFTIHISYPYLRLLYEPKLDPKKSRHCN